MKRKGKQRKEKIVSVRVPTALLAKIKEAGKREERTQNWLIVKALREKYGEDAQ